MKREMISLALDQLDMKYINEALEEGARTRKASRRALTGILAAAAVLVCTMGIAMAASPTVRAAVLTFFHLEESEQVPGPGDMAGDGSGTPTVIGNDIGGQVKAQYIQWGDVYRGRMVLEEDGGSHVFRIWDVEDGVLSEQKIEARESAFSFTWRGADYQGSIYWGVSDGELVSSGGGDDMERDTQWYTVPVSGRTDVVLLHISQGSQSDYESYELLYHLETGEVQDILAGTGVEDLEYAYDYAWTKNLSGLIVTCPGGEQFDSAKTYYCDMTAKTLTEIGTLTGTDADYATFADDETLIVSSFTDTACSAWAYNLTTGQTVQVLDQAHCYRSYDEEPYGILFSGARYGVYVEPSGQISVFDFKTGERTPVDGFTLGQDSHFLSNDSNTKLLYWAADDSVGGLGVSELGVLDLEKGGFLSFDREGYDTLYEWGLSWFDNDRVAIYAQDSQNAETTYLYLYEF